MIFLNTSANLVVDVPLHPSIVEQGVLIVDDSRLQRKSAEQCLIAFGVDRIYEAANGQEALTMLKTVRTPPAVMLLDLEMPLLDGIEVLQHLATEDNKPAIILVSSSEEVLISAVAAMAEALHLPILGAFRKPVYPAKLASALANFEQIVKVNARTVSPTVNLCVERLRSAINNNLIVPFYQPKIDLQSPTLAGLEALARWNDENGNAISPEQFISLAEKNNLICALTMSILDQVLDDMVRWNAQGLFVPVAINLSALSLADTSFANAIIQRVIDKEVPSRQITFEVTESALVINLPAALATISRLRLKGFGCSIDDYGTGFSSMQQLSRFPFSELKIDRSFVSSAPTRQHVRNILGSAIDMGRRLGIVTVAEGVESADELHLLKALGCKQAQGFLLARPMPGGDVIRWVEQELDIALRLCQT